MIENCPASGQCCLGHGPGSFVRGVLADPELEGTESLPAPVIDLRQCVICVGGIDVTEWQNALADLVAYTRGCFVGGGDLVGLGVVTAGEVAEEGNRLEVEAVETAREVFGVGEKAPVVGVCVDDSEALQLVE